MLTLALAAACVLQAPEATWAWAPASGPVDAYAIYWLDDMSAPITTTLTPRVTVPCDCTERQLVAIPVDAAGVPGELANEPSDPIVCFWIDATVGGPDFGCFQRIWGLEVCVPASESQE